MGRLAEGFGGFDEVSLITQSHAQIAVCLGKIRLDPDRLAEFGDRGVKLSLNAQGDAQIAAGLRRRAQPDRFAQLGDRFVMFALPAQQHPQDGMGLDVVGLEPGRFAVFGDCGVTISQNSQGISEIEMMPGLSGRSATETERQRIASWIFGGFRFR